MKKLIMIKTNLFSSHFFTLLLILFIPLLSLAEIEKDDNHIKVNDIKIETLKFPEIVKIKCYLCHGIKGEGSSSIYPRLAGQHKEYIIKQLKDFKSGKRKSIMNEMAVDLSEQDIIDLAEYFNQQPTLSHRIRNP